MRGALLLGILAGCVAPPSEPQPHRARSLPFIAPFLDAGPTPDTWACARSADAGVVEGDTPIGPIHLPYVWLGTEGLCQPCPHLSVWAGSRPFEGRFWPEFELSILEPRQPLVVPATFTTDAQLTLGDAGVFAVPLTVTILRADGLSSCDTDGGRWRSQLVFEAHVPPWNLTGSVDAEDCFTWICIP